jgi:hypothetical protein
MADNGIRGCGRVEDGLGDDSMLVFSRQGIELLSADEPSWTESSPRSRSAVALQLRVGNSAGECVGSRDDAGHGEMLSGAVDLDNPHAADCG